MNIFIISFRTAYNIT